MKDNCTYNTLNEFDSIPHYCGLKMSFPKISTKTSPIPRPAMCIVIFERINHYQKRPQIQQKCVSIQRNECFFLKIQL